MAEEERQQQRADVRAIDIRVRHDDDLVVAELRGVEIVLADARAHRGDEGADFLVAEHAVVAGLLDVEDLAFERQDRLEAPVAALCRGAACRFAFDEEQFTARRIALLAVAQLARQAAGIERALAPSQIAGFSGRFTRARGVDRLADDLASSRTGFFSKYSPSLSLTSCCTWPAISLLSRPLVWPSNCGCGTFTLMTAVSPSRTSSPVRFFLYRP